MKTSVKKSKIVVVALALVSCATIGYFSYDYLINLGMTTESITLPLSEEKEAFETVDLSVEETLKFPLAILTVKPSTEDVDAVKQISVTFNKPMVPLGDFEKAAQNFPITITPKVDCTWHWLNRLTIACDLDKSLPKSTAYSVQISPEVTAFDGSKLGAEHAVKFTTKKWQVVSEQVEWKDADMPAIYLTFDQEIDQKSLQAKITSGCGPIAVAQPTKKEAEGFGFDLQKTYLLTFDKKLGLDRECKIFVPGDVAAKEGREPGREHNVQFRTYPEFRISEVNCGYQNFPISATKSLANNQFDIQKCGPNNDVTIIFSSPIYGKNLAGKLQVNPFFGWTKNGTGSPEFFKKNGDESYMQVTLKSPLNGRDKHIITLLPMKDIFGRALKANVKSIAISTTDFNPNLRTPSDYSVIEKVGPHQLAYDAVNIKQFNVEYDYKQTGEGLGKAFRLMQLGCNNYPAGKTPKSAMQSSVVATNAKINLPISSPIDLDKIVPKFQGGIVLGIAKNQTNIEGVITEPGYVRYENCSTFLSVVTDLGIMTKIGFYDSAVWVHSIRSGKPVTNVKIQLRTYKNDGVEQVLAEGTTDAEGFVKLDGAFKWDPYRKLSNEKMFVVAQSKDDISMLPLGYIANSNASYEGGGEYGGEGESYFNYSSYYKLSKSSNHLVHAITDRPLYQPGQSVKIKVFSRNWEPRTFGLSPEKNISITVSDSLGKAVHKADLNLSDYGTATSEFNLEATASLGSYSISGKTPDGWSGVIGDISVEEFTLPPFKVTVTPIKTRFLAGGSAVFKTNAKYHFGGALSDTKGNYSAAFQESAWSPTQSQWRDFQFTDYVSFNIPSYEKSRSQNYFVIEEGGLLTNKDGDLFKSIILSPNEIRTHGQVVFESKFQDDRGKTIADRASAEIFYSDLQLGVKATQWSYSVGDKIKPEIVLLNIDEKPIAGKAVTLELIYRNYKTIRSKTSGNYFGYETRTIDKVVDECKVTSKTSIASCSLKTKFSGQHFILATSSDSKNYPIKSSVSLYITGSDYVGWNREDNDNIQIVADKESYEIGEEVALLIKNPYETVDAIITLERFGILKKFRKTLSGGAQTVKINLDSKDYAPGFYVAVQLIKGRVSEKIEGGVDLGKPSFKTGFAQIKVINPDTVLDIDAKTDKTDYEPGEEVEVKLKVQSPSGNKKAELAIAVVDGKILQLAGNYKGMFRLHDKFYQVPNADVDTYQMLSHLVGRRHFGRKGVSEGGDGDGIAYRKDFLPLAYWNPALETDSSGKVSFKFKVPDNLTSWHILVVAVDQEHRFGFGENLIRTNKKLMIEPALPSFLTEGDKLKARFSVFNRVGVNGSVNSSLDVSGAEIINSASKQSSLQIANDAKGFLEWLVQVPYNSLKAKFNIKATFSDNKSSDAAEYEFPIRKFTSYETFSHSGSTTGDSVQIPLEIPKDTRPELGNIQVIVSPSIISGLNDAISYNLEYPYQCWEQKMSRILTLRNYLGLKPYLTDLTLEKDPRTWISELLGEMKKFQAYNGGMSFWKPEYSTVDPHLSVYTALGMVWLNQDQIPIPEESSQKLFQYVNNILNGVENFPFWYSNKTKAETMAMAAYVVKMLGGDVTSSVNKLYQNKQFLSLFGKSFLWSAAARDERTKPIAEALKNEIFSMSDITSGKIQFQEIDETSYRRTLYSEVRSNCKILTSLLEQDSQGIFVEPLVKWIIDAQKLNKWGNTQENVYCLDAIKNYAAIYEKTKPNFDVVVKVSDKDLGKMKFKDYNQQPIANKMPLSNFKKEAPNAVTIVKSGEGRLYYTAKLRIAYKNPRLDPVNFGMKLERNYYVKSQSGAWVKQSNTVNIKRGDLVKIELKVSVPAQRYHVALADAIPAGLEPLNVALASTSVSDANAEGNTRGGDSLDWYNLYSSGGFYHREMRLFGAQYFADSLPAGEYNLSYVAQAIAEGEFNTPPAIVEQMYEPEVYGKSSPAKFTITN